MSVHKKFAKKLFFVYYSGYLKCDLHLCFAIILIALDLYVFKFEITKVLFVYL